MDIPWVNDPASISAFSRVLASYEPRKIADRLAEVVYIAFHLDVAYVCLRDKTGVHEAIQAAATYNGTQIKWPHLLIQSARRSGESSHQDTWDENGLRFLVRPIGLDAELGFIGAASRRKEFPTPINVMLLEFIAQFTSAVVREHETKRPAVHTPEPSIDLLASLLNQAKERSVSKGLIPSHRLYTRPSMTGEELKKGLKTLRLSQGQLARCISVSSATVKKWCQGRARIPGPAILLIQLMLRHESS